MWAIYDIGSSISAAKHEEHIPGADLKHKAELGAAYHTATGDPFYNKGNFDIEFETENKHMKTIDFNNANVSIPILSASLWNKQGHSSHLQRLNTR